MCILQPQLQINLRFNEPALVSNQYKGIHDLTLTYFVYLEKLSTTIVSTIRLCLGEIL